MVDSYNYSSDPFWVVVNQNDSFKVSSIILTILDNPPSNGYALGCPLSGGSTAYESTIGKQPLPGWSLRPSLLNLVVAKLQSGKEPGRPAAEGAGGGEAVLQDFREALLEPGGRDHGPVVHDKWHPRHHQHLRV